jgi:hypothetical protein
MAAGATYEPIATQTLASAAASITFSSIAASWTDLRVTITGTITTGTTNLYCKFNGSSSGYSYTYLYGDGASASSGSGTAQTSIILTASAIRTTPTFRTMDIFSYAGSTYKTVLITENADNNGSGAVNMFVELWQSTSAITSMVFSLGASTFAAGTSITLYGIKSA